MVSIFVIFSKKSTRPFTWMQSQMLAILRRAK
jgi:hypothetical protein